MTQTYHGFTKEEAMKEKLAQKTYDTEFKIQAVKFIWEIWFNKAAKELDVNADTLYGWNKHVKEAILDLGPGTQTPGTTMSLAKEVQLRQQNKEQAKEIDQLSKKEMNFLGKYLHKTFCLLC